MWSVDFQQGYQEHVWGKQQYPTNDARETRYLDAKEWD